MEVYMTITQLILLGVLVVAMVIGYFLINNVPSLLHTPLMSGMNALSGVTILGALAATDIAIELNKNGSVIAGSIMGGIAIMLAMINVVGGFAVTDKMLKMIVKKKIKGDKGNE
jgi:NAD(P) transhydrogenase subunit alpha